MVKSISSSLSSLHTLYNQSNYTLSYIKDLLSHQTSSPSLQSDPSQLEEISSLVSTLQSNSSLQLQHLKSLSTSFDSFSLISNSLKLLKIELTLLRTTFKSSSTSLQQTLSQLQTIHKEYKSRCQSSFLDFLKGIDIDLRKILKPLVPSSVIKDQVKFPLINSNSSLCSSVQSIGESIPEGTQEEINFKSQPEPAELTVQKLNTHIQMLVGTLENIAKDLIQVLTETDREYYQQLNNIEVYSRPPTPLAAALPDYFCYELQGMPQEHFKPMLTNESKELWIKRLNKLHSSRGIKEPLYRSLIGKLKKSTQSKKLDLREMFANADVTVSERESLVYYLINGTTEFGENVSLSQMMSETRIKPEPPKNPKPKIKPLHKIEKDIDRKSPITPDHEVARISQGNINHSKPTNSIRLGSKSPKIQKIFNNRKSVRVRSITPVEKEKTLSTKARTPSVQNHKVSFNTLNSRHRLRKNL